MEPKKKRGRPPKIRKIDPVTPEVAAAIYNAEHPEQHTSVYVMTPELEAAIENAIAESPKPPRIKDVDFPSNWDTMGKIDRLKFLTANRKK